MKEMPKLTRKQTRFVDEFVATGNGTQSALKAYEIESEKPKLILPPSKASK